MGDFGGSFRRSLVLGLMVMLATVGVSCSRGLAFRRKFIGSTALFYLSIASLIVPSIIVSLGIGVHVPAPRLPAVLVDIGVRRASDLDAALRPPDHVRGLQPLRPAYEEAARDLGASCVADLRPRRCCR